MSATASPRITAPAVHRHRLPQLAGAPMLTDGGIETTLIFHDGIDLPLFAAFPLLDSASGRRALRRYYDSYLEVAARHGTGLVLESPTWRANPDWAAQLGYDDEELERLNRAAIKFLVGLRNEYATAVSPIVISGCVGPQGDGYDPEVFMTSAAAQAYHARQIETFAATQADLVTAITMTYVEEAIGIVRAARAAGIPVAISFTVETDGRLPSGQELGDAIAELEAKTGGGPDYVMLNCAHPTHFEHVLASGVSWVDKIRGLRMNASKASHAELDEATELDDGDPLELAADHARLQRVLPNLTVLGGCCGTDHRHVDAIAAACLGSG